MPPRSHATGLCRELSGHSRKERLNVDSAFARADLRSVPRAQIAQFAFRALPSSALGCLEARMEAAMAAQSCGKAFRSDPALHRTQIPEKRDHSRLERESRSAALALRDTVRSVCWHARGGNVSLASRCAPTPFGRTGETSSGPAH